MKLKPVNMKSAIARNVGAILGVTALAVTQASAALDTSELTGAITAGITKAEALIGAGFALLAVFIITKIIKKGASKIA